jgi:hypothetical protein
MLTALRLPEGLHAHQTSGIEHVYRIGPALGVFE